MTPIRFGAWVRVAMRRWRLIGHAYTEDGARALFEDRHDRYEKVVLPEGVPPIGEAMEVP